MAFLDFLLGKDEKTDQFQRFTPDQQGVLNQILGKSAGGLGQGFDFLQSILGGSPEAMQRFQAPARRAFEEQTLPSIAERFSSLGAQKSSAFGQQLGEAGKRLEESLAAQRSGLGLNALQQLQQLLGVGLTPQFENVLRPATGGFLGGLSPGLGYGIGSLAQLLPLLAL